MRYAKSTALAVAIALLVGGGCRRSAKATSSDKVDLTFVPSPPTVGEAHVTVTLADAAGKPLDGGEVHLEGDMNHAGMKPTFADLKADGPGRYSGTLEFTMGGDWFILVTAKMPDGRQIERRIDVRGVKAK